MVISYVYFEKCEKILILLQFINYDVKNIIYYYFLYVNKKLSLKFSNIYIKISNVYRKIYVIYLNNYNA